MGRKIRGEVGGTQVSREIQNNLSREEFQTSEKCTDDSFLKTAYIYLLIPHAFLIEKSCKFCCSGVSLCVSSTSCNVSADILVKWRISYYIKRTKSSFPLTYRLLSPIMTCFKQNVFLLIFLHIPVSLHSQQLPSALMAHVLLPCTLLFLPLTFMIFNVISLPMPTSIPTCIHACKH